MSVQPSSTGSETVDGKPTGALRRVYRNLGRQITSYWETYGGIRALALSPYLHASVVLSIVLFREWSRPEWWNTPLGVVPNVLGFTLGGYAILISFGNDRFKELLSRAGTKTDGRSRLLSVSSSFMHFIMVQVVTLIWAVVAKGTYFSLSEIGLIGGSWSKASHVFGIVALPLWWFGYLLFIYSLFTSLAAALAIFKLTGLFVFVVNEEGKSQESQSDSNRDQN